MLSLLACVDLCSMRVLTGESTGNPAATDRELAFWETAMMRRQGKCLLAIRMIPWEDDFSYVAAQVLFASNHPVFTWLKGVPMPLTLVPQIVDAIEDARAGSTRTEHALRRDALVEVQELRGLLEQHKSELKQKDAELESLRRVHGYGESKHAV